jgi:hypothetical protein
VVAFCKGFKVFMLLVKVEARSNLIDAESAFPISAKEEVTKEIRVSMSQEGSGICEARKARLRTRRRRGSKERLSVLEGSRLTLSVPW